MHIILKTTRELKIIDNQKQIQIKNSVPRNKLKNPIPRFFFFFFFLMYSTKRDQLNNRGQTERGPVSGACSDLTLLLSWIEGNASRHLCLRSGHM